MAYSYVEIAGNGSQTVFPFSFGYISEDHITVTVDDVEAAFTFASASSVTVSPAPAADAVVKISRTTPLTSKLVDFNDGSTLTESDLDLANDQIFYVMQETIDSTDIEIAVGAAEDAVAAKVAAEAAQAAAEAIVGFDLPIQTADLDALIVTDAKLAANSVTTAKITDLNVTAAKLAAAVIHDLTAVTPAPADHVALADASDSNAKKKALVSDVMRTAIKVAVNGDTAAVVAGTAKKTFRMPFAMAGVTVRAELATAQTSGSVLTVDINEAGTTILSTKLTFDNGEKTTVTAATPAVVSDASLADDAEITIDVDGIGDGTAKGLKVTILGHPVL